MTDPEIYLEKLSAFSRILRLEGLSVSPRETEDACRLLASLDLTRREQVKIALRTVFAKTREEQLAFDTAFDNFFVSEEAMRTRAREQALQNHQAEQAKTQAQEEFQINGEPIGLTDSQKETYAAMPEDMRNRLRNFMDKYRTSAERNPELYGDFIHSVFTRTLLEQQIRMEEAAIGAAAMDPEIGILYRDISQFKDAEIPKAIETIQKIAQQINGELSAKRHRFGHSSKLDFRATIRKGLETGGSFNRLKYKKKHHRRKRLVLLCDVSGSMVQFSEFALRFIQSLNQISDNSRTFLFSEILVEADAFQMQNMDTFRNYVKESGIYGRGTDLGSALAELCGKRPPLLDASTTLIILSDTKTVDQSRAVVALLEAKHKAGQVIWLNPIPQNRWQYLKSANTISSLCQMIPCSTLGELGAACRKLTRV